MATITRHGNEYIISANMGYDYDSKKIQPVQKVVIPPDKQIKIIKDKLLINQ